MLTAMSSKRTGARFAELAEQMEEGVAVLAAAHRDEDAVAVGDHVEVGDGAAHGAVETGFQHGNSVARRSCDV